MSDTNQHPPTQGEQPSKKALKKAEKEKKKEEAKAQKAATKQAQDPKQGKEEEKHDNFGNFPLIQSAERTNRVFTHLKDLDESKANQKVLIRGRIHSSRGTGNLCFLNIRQRFYSVQAVIAKGKEVSKAMVQFVSGVNKESIVEIEGTVALTKEKILSTTQQSVEIQVSRFFVISEADSPLPLLIEDAARPKSFFQQQDAEIQKLEAQIQEIQKKIEGKETLPENKELFESLQRLQKQKGEAQKYVEPKRETRLDNRILDLRTPANQAIFKLQSAVGQLFREFLLQNEFTEIHSPKLLGAASEGGAEVFRVKYFENWAFLAQSPQLYKQMAICADLERVFEIAPVFRAEKSFTHRHLTEFVGLDLEMSFNEHYHEVLDVLDGLFNHIFTGLKTRFAKELEIVSQQYPFQSFKHKYPSPRIRFSEGVKMLREIGEKMDDFEDLNTDKERKLGALIREKYDTDFFMLDRFPTAVRPFYTMPSPDDPKYSNSYDFFIRGEEIMSGAQRVHDPKLLEKRALECKVGVEGIKDYVSSFRYGAMPHAGGGIGLERVVMLYLGLENIRQTSMFPRDPNRTTP